MKLFLTRISRITTLSPQMIKVSVSANNDTKQGYVGATFDIEIQNENFMKMTLEEIESLAISRAEEVIPILISFHSNVAHFLVHKLRMNSGIAVKAFHA